MDSPGRCSSAAGRPYHRLRLEKPMETTMKSAILRIVPMAALAAAAGCGGDNGLPQLTAAKEGTLANCTSLATGFTYANTVITTAELVPAGTLTNAGQPVGEHCRVVGRMNQRVSAVDGQTYAIGFEMRMPRAWSGRFLYQGNGGTGYGAQPAAVGQQVAEQPGRTPLTSLHGDLTKFGVPQAAVNAQKKQGVEF